MSLLQLAKRLHKLKTKADRDPLFYWTPTPPQQAYINDPSPVKALIGGNQVGKTMASAALLIYTCLNRHPNLKTDPPPVECWLITHSHEQSRTIQQKLYDLIPKDELHHECEFVRGRGFRGLAPVVRFKNGSIIRIKTANQGLGLASSTVSLCVLDEPVDQQTYNECLARTLRGGADGKRGVMALSLTPVGNVDVQYLKNLIDEGKISAHYAKLTLQDTTPIGLKPLLSQEQIDSITSAYLPIDREARVNASFDVIPMGSIFSNFESDMISSQPVPTGGDYHFCIGIDHGSNPGAQVCILACVDMREPQQPRVYILAERVSGQAPPEHHAQSILEMLKEHGLDPVTTPNKWTGDGQHFASRGARGFTMSNIHLMRAFESILGYPPKNLPWKIHTAIKRRHSVFFGASLLHSIMSRRHFWIRPECIKTIRSIKRWTMKRTQSQRSRDSDQHCIDAMRYCLTSTLDHKYTGPSKIKVF